MTLEAIGELRAKKKSGFLLKLDYEKALSGLGFPRHIFMERKGFGDKWRMWIHGCLSSANFTILINGRP